MKGNKWSVNKTLGLIGAIMATWFWLTVLGCFVLVIWVLSWFGAHFSFSVENIREWALYLLPGGLICLIFTLLPILAWIAWAKLGTPKDRAWKEVFLGIGIAWLVIVGVVMWWPLTHLPIWPVELLFIAGVQPGIVFILTYALVPKKNA